MRVVLDTNVLISALISARSAPAQVFDLWQQGQLEIVTSQAALDELQRVLTYPRIRSRLRYSDEQLERFLLLLREYAVFLEDLPRLERIAVDADDDKFLAMAQVGGAAYIVSGDDHLLSMATHQGIAIVSPSVFLTIFGNTE